MELWYTEKQTENLDYSCKITRTLHTEKTDFQDLDIIDTLQWGRMLVLDGMSNNNEINNPIAGRAETGTGLTFYGANVGSFEDNDTRILQGADPSNSGYGDEGYGIAGGKAFLLTLVTSEDNLEKAVSIIKNHHGQV